MAMIRVTVTAAAANTYTAYHGPGYSSKVGRQVFLILKWRNEHTVKWRAQRSIPCKQQSWDYIGSLWRSWVVRIWYWSTENKEWAGVGGFGGGRRREELPVPKAKSHKQIPLAFCHPCVRLLKCVGKGRDEKRFEKFCSKLRSGLRTSFWFHSAGSTKSPNILPAKWHLS